MISDGVSIGVNWYIFSYLGLSFEQILKCCLLNIYNYDKSTSQQKKSNLNIVVKLILIYMVLQ